MSSTRSTLGEILRNSHAITVAVGLSLLLLWIFYQMENAPTIISQINIDAVIVETKDRTYEEINHHNLIKVKLKLPDNKTCTVTLNKKYQPIVGKTVPLILKTYDNKTSKCLINYHLLSIF